MLHDFKFAFRQLVKAPAFSAAAVFVLALGIGANTAIFSLMNTLLFQPPHYAKPGEVVQVFSQDRKNPESFRGFSYPTYLDIRDRNSVFSGVMAHNLAMVGLGEKSNTRRAFTDVVSANYFSVMGVKPMLGRAFRPEEETPGRDSAVAIVSYNYWKREGLNPALLGSIIRIDARPYTVIGILPQGFTGTTQIFAPEIWLPLGVYDQVANDFETENKDKLTDRAGRQFMIVGRLKPGITATAAAPALKNLAANLEHAYPVEQKDQTFMVAPLSRFSLSTSPSSGSNIKRLAPLLFGMSGVVLLVACLNLANMLLARGAARRKEIAIRLALGSSRWRVVRQLLVEGFLLALAGGVFGLLLGLWSSDLLVASLGGKLPIDLYWQSGLSAPVLVATLVFCLLGTLAFALGPALKLSKSAVIGDLKEHAGEDTVVRRARWLPRNPLGRGADRIFARAADRGCTFYPRRKQGGQCRYRVADKLELSLGNRRQPRDLRSGTSQELYRTTGRTARCLARSRAHQHLFHGPVWDDRPGQIGATRRRESAPGLETRDRRRRSRIQCDLEQRGRGLFQDCRSASFARTRIHRRRRRCSQTSPRVAIIDEVLIEETLARGQCTRSTDSDCG